MADKDSLIEDVKSFYIDYCESHETWQKSSKVFDSARKIERKLLAVRKAAHLLEKSVRTLLTLESQDSEEHKRFTKMLVHALICKLEWMCEDLQPHDDCFLVFEEIMTLLEPTDDDLAKIFTIQMMDMNTKFNDLENKPNRHYNLDVMKSLAANIKREEENQHEWKGPKVFGVPLTEQSLYFDEYQEQHDFYNVFNMFRKHQKRVEEKRWELCSNLLNEMPSYNIITQKLKSKAVRDNFDALAMLEKRVNPLMKLRYLKQAHHIISLGLYYTNKLRSIVPFRSMIDVIEGEFLGMFAQYVLMLVNGRKAEEQGLAPEINNEFIELTEVIQEGYEEYSSKFPTECPESREEVEELIERGIEWADRAISLCEAYPESSEQHKHTKSALTLSLKIKPYSA